MKNIFMILFIFGCLLFTNQSYCDSPTSELDEQQKAIKQLQEEISTLSRNFQQFQSQQQLKDHLQREVSEFKNTFLDKTLKNVDLALQGSNKAISLITVFALSFTIITFLLGLFGFREIAAINKARSI